MKRIKSKVAIGIVAAGMVASMGTAFAATDAGAQIKGWYSTASSAVKATVTGDFASYYLDKTTTHAVGVVALTANSVSEVKTAGESKTQSVQNSINGQVNQYSGQIDAAQASIASSMPGEYDKFVSATNFTTNLTVGLLGAGEKKVVPAAIDAQESASVKKLSNDVSSTQAAAAQALNDKIAASKAELQRLLAEEQKTATKEVKDNLDAKIKALEDELAALAASNVTDAKAAINAKGDELLNKGLSDLDAIVKDINKK